jgi:hypothetical protein
MVFTGNRMCICAFIAVATCDLHYLLLLFKHFSFLFGDWEVGTMTMAAINTWLTLLALAW